MVNSSASTAWIEALGTVKQRRIGVQLAALLRDQTAGQPLPPERELVRTLGVSRPTLRIVLEQMQQHGLIRAFGPLGRQTASPHTDQPRMLSHTVAVFTCLPMVVADEDPKFWGWEIYIQSGAMRGLQRHGWDTLMMDPGKLDPVRVLRMASEGLAGLIVSYALMPADAMDSLQHIVARAGVPAAIYGNEQDHPGHDTVDSDHAAGAAMLTRWLIERRCRRIVRAWHFDPDEPLPPWLRQRSLGHERAMAQAGLAALPEFFLPGPGRGTTIEHKETEVGVRTTAGYLLDLFRSPEPPDALMALSDGEAAMMTAALRLLGWNIPVVGYDNYSQVNPYKSELASDPVATIDKLNPRIGAELADLLTARVRGRLPDEPQHRLVPPRLVVNVPG